MNVLGLKISVDHAPSASMKWTRRTGALAGTLALVMGGGIAYASWSATGSGSGTAAVGAASTVTMSGTVSDLYPLEDTTLPLTVTNPNTNFPVKVTSIQFTGLATPLPTGCSAGDISLDATAAGVSGSTFTPSSNTTIAKSGQQTYSVPIHVADLANDCQSKSFTVNFTVNATS